MEKIDDGDGFVTGSEPEKKLMVGEDFDSRYRIVLRSMAKQQLLLEKILNTKYSKKFGSSWKTDFKAIKEQCSKGPNNISDTTTVPEAEGDNSDSNTDSDSISDGEDYSGSEGYGKPEPKYFLDNILTAARPWSIDGRWKSIIKETADENMHQMT